MEASSSLVIGILKQKAGSYVYQLEIRKLVLLRQDKLHLSATTIKSGRVIAWKAIMTVEVAGLRGSRR